MALGLGFVLVEWKGLWLNQVIENAFYYGVDDLYPLTTVGVCEALAEALFEQLMTAPDTDYGVAAYRDLFTGAYRVTGLKVLVKGETGLEPIQIAEDLDLVGTHIDTADPLAPNLTCSFYARRRFLLGRGARTAFSGGLESEYGASGWSNAAGAFKDRCTIFCDLAAPPGGLDIPVEGAIIYPAVVPRIQYVSPSGKDANRLPLEPLDIPRAIEVGTFVAAPFAGTANSRKIPPRG